MMKNIIILVFLCPILSLAQESKEPFKRANVILIKTTLSNNDAYRLIGQELSNEGYHITNTEKGFYVVNAEKPVPPLGTLFVTASVKNGTIQISGQYTSNGIAGEQRFPLHYRKGLNTNATYWQKLQPLIDKFNKEYTYYTLK